MLFGEMMLGLWSGSGSWEQNMLSSAANSMFGWSTKQLKRQPVKLKVMMFMMLIMN